MKKLFNFSIILVFLSIPFVLGSSVLGFAQDAKSSAVTLPNGASSLTETYGLWSVSCGIQEGKKFCFMQRQEVSEQNRPILLMSIKLDSHDSVSGTLIVPFGVLVSKPISLWVDEGRSAIETYVRTCTPEGCLVPIRFDKSFVSSLRTGKKLKMSITWAAPNEPVSNNLFVQLGGFSNALNRLGALQK